MPEDEIPSSEPPPSPEDTGVSVPMKAAPSSTPQSSPPSSRPTSSHYVPELPLPEELQAMLGTGYVVESFLGQGGMGAVYRGLQMPLRRPVAIKILRKGAGGVEDDFGFEERFKREAYAMAALTHPNIVQVYDCGDAGGNFLFISMELVEGGDLSDAIKSGSITPERALKLIPQICDGLQAAHERGLVHRDIKPANIFLTADGRAKVADFGLAKKFDVKNTLVTQAGLGMGTPDYAAPEQYDGLPDIDHRADIYALGVMMYQMFTGCLPRGNYRPASQRAVIDPRIDPILGKAMEHDRADRYQSAAEIKAAFAAISSPPSTAVESVSKPPTPRPPSRPSMPVVKPPQPAVSASPPAGNKSGGRRWLFVALGLVAILSCAALFIMVRPHSSGARQSGFHPPPGPPGLVNYLPNLDGNDISNIALVDGDRKVLISGASPSYQDNLRLVDLATGEMLWHQTGDRFPRLHALPGGLRAIALSFTGGVIKALLIDVTTGQQLGDWHMPYQLRSGDFDFKSEPSPDGRHLAIGIQDRTRSPDRPATGWPVDLWVLDIDSMKTIAQWRPNLPVQLYSIPWLDADRILLSTSIKAPELFEFDLKRPNDPPVTRRSHVGLFIALDPVGQWLAGIGNENGSNNLSIASTADLLKAFTLRENTFVYHYYFVGDKLFVVDSKSNDILGFDLKSRALVTELHPDTTLDRLAMSRDGSFAVTREKKLGESKFTLIGIWRLRDIK